jgi:hypothetical protein
LVPIKQSSTTPISPASQKRIQRLYNHAGDISTVR